MYNVDWDRLPAPELTTPDNTLPPVYRVRSLAAAVVARGHEVLPPQPQNQGDVLREARKRLSGSWSAIRVFQEVLRTEEPHAHAALCETIENVYWNERAGVLVHPWVAELILRVEQSQPAVLEAIENLNVELRVAPTMRHARQAHAFARLRLLEVGRRSTTGGSTVPISAAEFVADYLLVQRAIAQDVRAASRLRAPGETTASMLDRMDSRSRTNLLRVMWYVTSPDQILAQMTEGLSDRTLGPELIAYLRTRSVPAGGVLAQFAE